MWKNGIEKAQLKIGEVAHLLGVTPKTVRHYHKLGLLPEPPRTEGGYRLYTGMDLLQLHRIRRLQTVGLSLAQIKDILDADHPDELLHQTLTDLRDELARQEARIAARRQAVEQYLAEGVTLARVEQPTEPSPTFDYVSGVWQNADALPPALSEFDRRILTQLDAFAWGDFHPALWQEMVDHLTGNPAVLDAMKMMMETVQSLENVDEFDPMVDAAVQQFAAHSTIKLLVPTLSFQYDAAYAEVLNQVTYDQLDQLSPAQRRFMTLLIEAMRATRSESGS